MNESFNEELDVPVLQDLLGDLTGYPVSRLDQVPDINLDVTEASPAAGSLHFYEVFFRVESLRQQLYEQFEYRVLRKINHLTNGNFTVTLVCPKSLVTPEQQTLTIGNSSNDWELQFVLHCLQATNSKFINYYRNLRLAKDVFAGLTPIQQAALCQFGLRPEAC